MLALLSYGSAQQICIREECKDELNACEGVCDKQMGKCMFTCKESQGCIEKCLGENTKAKALLSCTYDKCISA